MAVDMFLKIDGVDGEAQDKTHKDSIDILAWSWGMSQSATTHMGGGGGSGKANVQDISLTKYVDRSSSGLMTTCASGKHLPKALLTVRKAAGDGGPLEYIKITMEDCIISSLSTGGSGGEDRLTENISINFAKVKFEYFAQNADGSSKGVAPFGWDIAQNTKV